MQKFNNNTDYKEIYWINRLNNKVFTNFINIWFFIFKLLLF